MKIKLLHIVHDFLQGGIEGFLYYLVKEQLKKEELDVTILCLQDEHLVTNPRIKTLGVKVVYLKMRPFERSLGKYKKFIQILNAYDLIHWQIFKPILARVAYNVKPKQIFTVHTAGDALRSKSLYRKFHNSLIKSFLNGTIDGIANNSKFSKEYWISKGVKNPNNVVIYNGVFFHNQHSRNNAFNAHPELAGKFVIGTTSRLIPWKRVDFLIRAFSRMRNLNENIVLLIVGQGPETENLMRIAIENNVQDKIIFSGYRANVGDFQDAIDLCVFPSVSEPFGLVAVECLHIGKPVIVMRDGGGLVEIVEKVNNGLIADSENSLTELLDSFYENRDTEQNDINKRIEVAIGFSVEKCEEGYREFYKQVLASKSY